MSDKNVGAALDLLNRREDAAELMDGVTRGEADAIAQLIATLITRAKPTREWLTKMLEAVEPLVSTESAQYKEGSAARELSFLLAPLAKRGTLGSLRRCDVCKQWMFARRNQLACSALCAHKKYEQKPHAKERRKAYTRWRYAMSDSREWLDSRIPKNRRPTFEQWLEHKEPTPREWQTVLNAKKGRK